jgi:hypothetical protein
MDQAGTTKDATTQDIANLAGAAITAAIAVHDNEADPHNGASPTFADLTLTGLLTAPHIHGSLAGDVYVHVKNTSGGSLAANTAVYATGSVGDTDRIEVAACDPTDPAKMPAIGLLTTTLANNGEGDAIILGELRPTNTGSYTLGDELYVGAGGALVNTIPVSGTVQHVGSVARVHASTGTIVVGIGAGLSRVGFTGAYSDLSGTPTLVTSLDGLSDVTLSSPADQQVLKYDAATGQWINAVAPGGGGGTVSSVGFTAPTGFSVSGSPVTTSGTIALSYATGYQGFTSAEASKLAGIEAGAQVNVATNLTYSAASRLLSSSTGGDATLPLFTSSDAGLVGASGGGTTNFLRADGTWAAPAGGGGTVINPGYTTGNLIAPPTYRDGAVSSTPVAGLPTLACIYIPEATTFSGLVTRTWSNFSGTSTVQLGIYDHNKATNGPKDLIYTSGDLTFTGAVNSNYGPAGFSQTLQPGFYWLAFLAISNAATPNFWGPASNSPGLGYPWHVEFSSTGAATTIGRTNAGGLTALPANLVGNFRTDSFTRPIPFLVV